MSKERWTTEDEAVLQGMLKRRSELNAKNMKPLIELVRRENPAVLANEDLIGWMVAYADEIRDALEPFDSGIRVSPKEES